jgi:hypothetical protein
LDPSAGVKHGSEERVVTPSQGSCPIYDLEDRLEFLEFQVFYRLGPSSLERYAKKSLTLFEVIRESTCEVAKESVDGCKSDVAGCGTVAAYIFQMLKKGHDLIGIKIVNVQHNHLAPTVCCHKTEQEREAVAVAADRVWAHPPHSGKMVAEVVA